MNYRQRDEKRKVSAITYLEVSYLFDLLHCQRDLPVWGQT